MEDQAGPDLGKIRNLFVFPHPDDEVHSCLALWRRMRERDDRVTIDAIWLTTGCPASHNFTRNDDFQDYRARLDSDFHVVVGELRGHLLSAAYALPYESRDLHNSMTDAYTVLESLLSQEHYETVFVCPLEGAHPDHDAANVLVGALRRAKPQAFQAIEYSSYHLGPEQAFVNNVFLDSKAAPVEVPLDELDIEMKLQFKQMYSTELNLDEFQMRSEIFRSMNFYADMSIYEKRRPLYYETWDSRIDPSEVARTLAPWVGNVTA